MHDEAGLEEGLFDGAGAVEEKLRLDAVDVGRVQEEIEEGAKEGVGDVQGYGWVIGYCVGVSDDGFVSFVDAESEATDASAVECDEAGQDAGVEVLQQQLGRALVVPAQLLFPDTSLGFKQRTELACGEVPEVEDLELGVDCHCLVKKYFVELIAIVAAQARD
jgi:hypothetical protein